MKTLLIIVTLSLCQLVNAEDQAFNYRVYTPEVVVDQNNDGPKGAVQLLWQKNPQATRYEVEVSNGKLVYSQVGERDFHHVMLYFDRDYRWRVREVSARQTTEFSPWMPLKVVRGEQSQLAQADRLQEEDSSSDYPKERQPLSLDEASAEVDQYVLDTGDN